MKRRKEGSSSDGEKNAKQYPVVKREKWIQGWCSGAYLYDKSRTEVKTHSGVCPLGMKREGKNAGGTKKKKSALKRGSLTFQSEK